MATHHAFTQSSPDRHWTILEPKGMVWEMKDRYKGRPCTASHFDSRSSSWIGTAWPVAKDGQKLNVFSRAGREPCLVVAIPLGMDFTAGLVINALHQLGQDDSTRTEAVEHVAGPAGAKTLWTSWFGDPETQGSQLLRRQRPFGGRVVRIFKCSRDRADGQGSLEPQMGMGEPSRRMGCNWRH